MRGENLNAHEVQRAAAAKRRLARDRAPRPSDRITFVATENSVIACELLLWHEAGMEFDFETRKRFVTCTMYRATAERVLEVAKIRSTTSDDSASDKRSIASLYDRVRTALLGGTL